MCSLSSPSTHTHTRTNIHMHTQSHAHTHAHTHMCMHTNIHTHTHTLVMCITKKFHITYHSSSYSRYEYISQYDITYITYLQGAGKQVIIMNYLWLICILSSCLMFEGSFYNFDSSKNITNMTTHL